LDCWQIVGQPRFTKATHALQYRKERVAFPGQAILDSRRHLREARAADDFCLFQATQAV
jgi:hypothetical protein